MKNFQKLNFDFLKRKESQKKKKKIFIYYWGFFKKLYKGYSIFYFQMTKKIK